MPSIFKTGLVAAFAAVASAQFSNYTAPVAVSVPGWRYDGCVSSINAGRDFSFPGFTLVETSSTGMTVERCTADCSAYQFAAVSSGSCYCANAGNGTLPVPESSCRARCPGNPTEACGGTAGVLPVKRQITGFPYYSLYQKLAVVPAGTVYNIIITNIYIDICPTGYTTITALSTATLTGCGCPTATVPVIPVITTTVLCTACPKPGVVTVTVPAGVIPGTVTVPTITITGTPVTTGRVITATPGAPGVVTTIPGVGVTTIPGVVATTVPGSPAATTTRPATFTGAASVNGASTGGLLSLLLAAVALF